MPSPVWARDYTTSPISDQLAKCVAKLPYGWPGVVGLVARLCTVHKLWLQQTLLSHKLISCNEQGLTPSSLEAIEEVIEGEGCEAGGGRCVRPLQRANGCAVVGVQLDEPLHEQQSNHV